MKSKPWYTSKTVWATAITTLVSVYEVFALNFPSLHLPPVATGTLATVLGILGGLGLYGRVTAKTTLTT